MEDRKGLLVPKQIIGLVLTAIFIIVGALVFVALLGSPQQKAEYTAIRLAEATNDIRHSWVSAPILSQLIAPLYGGALGEEIRCRDFDVSMSKKYSLSVVTQGSSEGKVLLYKKGEMGPILEVPYSNDPNTICAPPALNTGEKSFNSYCPNSLWINKDFKYKTKGTYCLCYPLFPEWGKDDVLWFFWDDPSSAGCEDMLYQFVNIFETMGSGILVVGDLYVEGVGGAIVGVPVLGDAIEVSANAASDAFGYTKNAIGSIFG